jgi:small subunit ribosomal protein S17
MDKTVTVRVDRMVPHPLYGKYVRRSTKYHAHDEANECHTGDTVLIEESRPLSKTKAWKVASLVERGTKV